MNASASAALPSSELLRGIVLDDSRDLPLHAQLRGSLQRLILECFEDDHRFYSETQLVQHLGVSQGTVRRALADLASQGLLEKRPARGTLVRKASQAVKLKNLAVFLPDYSSPNVARILTVLNTDCLQRGVNLQPLYTHRGEQLSRAYEQLKFRPQEGAVILLSNSPGATTELFGALQDKSYDCVTIDTQLPDLAQNFVGVCNRTGNEIGMNHLRSLGHRRIALLVNEPEEQENVRERIRCFEEYCAKHPELEPSIWHGGIHLWENAGAVEKVMDQIWSSPNRPTAIFAMSEIGALGAIRWFQGRGVDVPGDVSVLGFDGGPLGTLVHPSLTTITQPFEEIAKTSIKLLMGERTVKPRQIFLAPQLTLRESTAAPKS
ncbi:MAG: substrate-binding domain-containing protein [Candidatus Methylacidiphilales bacterium]